MTAKIERIKREIYPEYAVGGFTRVDGTVQFYQRINALVLPDHMVLDIGAGRGQAHHDDPSSYRRRLRNFRGRVKRVIGIDVDPVVKTNPSLDEALPIDSGVFPVTSASIDLAIADYVFEHISDPGQFCNEIERVLKPGGWLCVRTPNRYGYISLASRLIPERLHAAILKVAQPDRKRFDVFPTHYRLNTRRDIERHLPPGRWQHHIFAWNAEPAYLGSSKAMWQLGRLVSALTPSPLGTTVMLFSQKKD
jgi:SAM-dependent methyltransferase